MVPQAHQGLDQDVAMQQHEGAHELIGAGLPLLPQPATAAHQLCMRHLHSTTSSKLLADNGDADDLVDNDSKNSNKDATMSSVKQIGLGS